LKIETKLKAPSSEGAGFLRSKKTEGKILNFFSFHRKRSPSSSEEGKKKGGAE